MADSAPRDAEPRPRATPGEAAKLAVRYAVPLLALAAIALAPVLVLAIGVAAPTNRAGLNAVIARGWGLIAVAWFGQLGLVGAATPIARAPLSQLRAFGHGLSRLVRAAIPCLAAAVTVAIASLALVVPGVLLLGLLAFTGASDARGLPAPLLDSLAFARRHLGLTARAAGTMLALDVALCAAAQLAFAHPGALGPATLNGAPHFVHAVALGLVVVSPFPTTWLALVRETP